MTAQPEVTGGAEQPSVSVNRKSRVGVVVSDKNDKTVIVAIGRAKRHRLYHKVIRTTKRYQVHDPENSATNGDLVLIEECRPISKLKRWQLVRVLTEREVADVAASEIDRSLVEEVQRSAAHAAEGAAGEASGTLSTAAAEPAPEADTEAGRPE